MWKNSASTIRKVMNPFGVVWKPRLNILERYPGQLAHRLIKQNRDFLPLAINYRTFISKAVHNALPSLPPKLRTDKIEVVEYISGMNGGEIMVCLLGLWREQISFATALTKT